MPSAPPSRSRASGCSPASRRSRVSPAPTDGTIDADLARGRRRRPPSRSTPSSWRPAGPPMSMTSASREAGVEMVRSAIPVDQYFRTSVPHIFAVGDANGRDMLVQAAQFEGEAAAENAVLDANRRTPHHLLPSGGFTDPDYAGVGLTEARGARARPELHRRRRAVHGARSRGDRRPRARLPQAHRRSPPRADPAAPTPSARTRSRSCSRSPPRWRPGSTSRRSPGVKFAYPTYSAIIGLAARKLLEEPVDGD